MANPEAADFRPFALSPSESFPQSEMKAQTIHYYKQQLTHTKHLVSNIAHDYRILGHRYHSLPPYVRYHAIAREDGIHLDAVRNFVVSSNHELPEMITILGTFEYVIKPIETLLAKPVEDVEDVDFRDLQSRFTMLETQFPYALVLLAKLQTLMRIYVVVVCTRNKVRRALQSGTVGDRIERRMGSMLDRWFQALPHVCFDRYPEAFGDAEDQEGGRESGSTEGSAESNDRAGPGSDEQVVLAGSGKLR